MRYKLDPEIVPIETHVDGKSSRFTVPGILTVELEPHTDPVSRNENEVQINLRNGFIWRTAQAIKSRLMKIATPNLNFRSLGTQRSLHYRRIQGTLRPTTADYDRITVASRVSDAALCNSGKGHPGDSNTGAFGHCVSRTARSIRFWVAKVSTSGNPDGHSSEIQQLAMLGPVATVMCNWGLAATEPTPRPLSIARAYRDTPLAPVLTGLRYALLEVRS